MTSVRCCGFECGLTLGVAVHASLNGTCSFNTTANRVRSGARSGRCNPTAGTGYFSYSPWTATKGMGRTYVWFDTLPSADTSVFTDAAAAGGQGAYFKQSDSKIYAGTATTTLGASGISVTTGQWYRIDARANTTNVDVSVDGVACGSLAASTQDSSNYYVGFRSTCTADAYFDDCVWSITDADYPIGSGFGNAFVPTADGTHNIAGINDFERSATGTDILNATTDAYLLIAKAPLDSTASAPTDYINLVAPANDTDYAECIYGAATGSSTPTTAPQAVDAIVGYAASATGTANIRLALNDNGTTNDVFNGNPALTNTNVRYTVKQYATAPTGGAWVIGGGGAGDFIDLRIRCFTNDPAPDPFFACTMIEADFLTVEAAPPFLLVAN